MAVDDKKLMKQVERMAHLAEKIGKYTTVQQLMYGVLLKKRGRNDLKQAIDKVSSRLDREMDNYEAQVEDIMENLNNEYGFKPQSKIITDLHS